MTYTGSHFAAQANVLYRQFLSRSNSCATWSWLRAWSIVIGWLWYFLSRYLITHVSGPCILRESKSWPQLTVLSPRAPSFLSLSLSSQWALAHAGPLKCHACVWTTGHKTWRALLHEIHELFTLQRLYKRSLATSSRLACLKGACAGSQADLFAELQKYTGDTYISNMGLMALCPRSDLQLICMFPAQ